MDKYAPDFLSRSRYEKEREPLANARGSESIVVFARPYGTVTVRERSGQALFSAAC